MESALDSGNTAWMLAATALVLFMTPGLALFYGGMVRAKNMLGMLMQNVFAMGLMAVLWVLIGYTLAFGGTGALVGNLDFAGFKDVGMGVMEGLTIPVILFAAFQMTFAIITPALITGATADRMKFGAYALFIGIWLLVVYSPVAHWVWGGGWVFDMGALDFAGGAVVHINAGAAALAMAILLGKRKGWPKEGMHPHSLPLTLVGTGILWFGWAGFNAGSALAADGLAAQAILNTFVAASAAMLGWVLAEWAKDGQPTTLGAASGAVAGLVAITPCAGFVGAVPSILIGFIAGIVCLFAIQLKYRFGYDDSLDVVGIHLVGGLTGALLLGLFADTAINPAGADGLFVGGGAGLLGKQFVASIAVLAFSFVTTLVIGKALDVIVGLRVTPEEEDQGLDLSQHAETAYNFGDVASMGRIG
ncbi:ammonium transporter [Rhabdothermincola sediminis]|uniref:ammonium transporter n=1 Tax=Rhabdothermincola sediminis TaxID=2751370 RepID=UPI001F194A17|nr:ammonium transporter [Rhabdothermincola sediminis]